METVSTGVLLVLGLVAFANVKNGTLGPWLRAKFFNEGEAPPRLTAGDVVVYDPASELPPGAAGTLSASYGRGWAPGLGALVTPVPGPITSGFGDPRDGGTRDHAGIDIAAPTGTPVLAARAGKVVYAGVSSGYGLRVDLDHGAGVRTRYAHLSRIDVRLGQSVAAGTTLGLVGSTGESTGPHLHFELHDPEGTRDPREWLGPGGVG